MDQLQETANENQIRSARFFSFIDYAEDQKPAAKLRLEYKNGNRCSLPYAYILRVEYETVGIIKLITSELVYVITGRGLEKLEENLHENRVKTIRESKVVMDSGQGDLFIKSISVEPK